MWEILSSGRLVGVFCLAQILLAGCGENGAEAVEQSTAPPPATPVQTTQVTLRTIEKAVSAPGSTVSTAEETVRAPFAGTISNLAVSEGDQVSAGDPVATIIARDSEAQLTGAAQMLQRAKTAAAREDARRALQLAQENLVETSLASSVNGVVKSRAVTAGERVSDNQDLLTVSSLEQLMFVADVDQSRMTDLKPGNAALVHFSGVDHAVNGTVQSILPGTTANMTTPVRIDINGHPPGVGVGLTGTAEIVVSRHENVPSVPESAVLRDDVGGQRKIAVVDGQNQIHWRQVQTGYARDGHVELLEPRLAPGTTVVTSGQVGLSEGTPVTISP